MVRREGSSLIRLVILARIPPHSSTSVFTSAPGILGASSGSGRSVRVTSSNPATLCISASVLYARFIRSASKIAKRCLHCTSATVGRLMDAHKNVPLASERVVCEARTWAIHPLEAEQGVFDIFQTDLLMCLLIVCSDGLALRAVCLGCDQIAGADSFRVCPRRQNGVLGILRGWRCCSLLRRRQPQVYRIRCTRR